MTCEEFNEKYKAYLVHGHYGMAINDSEVIEYMDKEFEREIEKDPEFEYYQIKLKFMQPRVYSNSTNNTKWEKNIRDILTTKK